MPKSKIKERYSKESLKRLYRKDNGIPIATASQRFGISRITLLYKKVGKYPRECRKEPSTNLTNFEENSLIKRHFHIADRGFPAIALQLIDSVEILFKETKRKNFVGGKPGKK